MKRALLSLAVLLWAFGAAHADFSRAALDKIAAAPKPNAQLPLDARFVDEQGAPRTLGQAIGGKPSVVIFTDYTCRTLCGPILAFAASGLEKSGLTPGHDYHLVVVGIDPKDSLKNATAFEQRRLGKDTALSRATVMLTGKADAVRAATEAAGYSFAYDPAHDQFAHPAAAYVVSGDGHIARVLSGIGLDSGNLRLALVDAGKGKIGGLVDRIHLLCYGFDPARGIYTASIGKIADIACALTVLAMVTSIGGMMLARRRSGAT